MGGHPPADFFDKNQKVARARMEPLKFKYYERRKLHSFRAQLSLIADFLLKKVSIKILSVECIQ